MRRLKKELWPFKVTLNSDQKDNINPVEVWLGETFGMVTGRWNVVYRFNCTDFYFRNAQDASYFSLRWL